MKTGKNISELAAEVTRQANNRHDLVTRTTALRFADEGGTLIMELFGHGHYGVNDLAHNQIADYAGIPGAFYGRLQSQYPDLLAASLNRLIPGRQEKRLVRTLDGTARAFLSDRYRCIDNVDLLEQLLPVLMERPDLRFASAELTERRLYLKVVSDELAGDVKPGDTIRMGIILSNSEVGLGSVTVAPFSERLICTNGAVHLNYGRRRPHIGREQTGEGEAWELYTDETRRADDRAFFLKVRDTIQATLSGDVLGHVLEDMREAAGERIDGDPAQVVEVIATQHGLVEAERGAVLRNLIEGADLSRWGVANAVTRAAQDATSYDRATELEQLGGALLTRPLPAAEDVRQVTPRRRTRRVAELAAAN